MAQQKRHCIFCGQPKKLTKEHFFGKWFRDLNKITTRTSHLVSRATATGFSISAGRLNRNGSPGSHQIKIVCEDCNRGWMSRIQEEVKPIVVSLFKDCDWKLTPYECALLCRWATMASMCLEFAGETGFPTPQSERDYLRQKLSVPDGYEILLGACSENLEGGEFWRRAGEVQFIDKDEEFPVSTTIITLGHSFLLVAKIPDEYRIPLDIANDTNADIRRIWPLPENLINRPAKLNQYDVWDAPNIYWQHSGAPPKPHGWQGSIERD